MSLQNRRHGGDQGAMPFAGDELRGHADGFFIIGKTELGSKPVSVLATGLIAFGIDRAVYADDFFRWNALAEQHLADALGNGDDALIEWIFQADQPARLGVVDAPTEDGGDAGKLSGDTA